MSTTKDLPATTPQRHFLLVGQLRRQGENRLEAQTAPKRYEGNRLEAKSASKRFDTPAKPKDWGFLLGGQNGRQGEISLADTVIAKLIPIPCTPKEWGAPSSRAISNRGEMRGAD